MSAGAQARGWQGQARRKSTRFHLHAPVDVTVLRSGVPQPLPGRCLNLGERGVAGVLAGELVPGEIVGVELRLPLLPDALLARARVCYHDKLRCGLEFLGLSDEQRAAIREWAVRTKAKIEADPDIVALDVAELDVNKLDVNKLDVSKKDKKAALPAEHKVHRKTARARLLWAALLIIIAAGSAAGFWWKWKRGWEQLESGLKNADASEQAPSVQVPAEVMEKLLVHRVEPVYPPEAKKERLEGIIALDVVIGRDGSVVNMHPLNGPDILARAAMDALRWWRFEPYRVNGEPAAVETTLAVEFKR